MRNREKPIDSDSDDDSSWGLVISHTEHEDSAPAVADNIHFAQETDEDVPYENASASDVEMARQEETPAVAPSQAEDEPTQEVPPRRSSRQRKLPVRYQTGDFLMNKCTTRKEDWERKVSCITSLVSNSSLLSNLQDEAGRAILEILSNK